MKFFVLFGAFALSSWAAATGTWSVVSTTATITCTNGPYAYLSYGNTPIDNRTTKVNIDLDRSPTGLEAFSLSSISNGHGFMIHLVSVLRYIAEPNEIVSSVDEHSCVWKTRELVKAEAANSFSPASATINWEDIYIASASGASSDIDGTNIDMYGDPHWTTPIIVQDDFNLQHISGYTWEGTAEVYYEHDLSWNMSWESYPLNETVIQYVKFALEKQWKVTNVDFETYPGY